MIGSKLDIISFELRCLSYWCDDGLQPEAYKVDLLSVSDWCHDWLEAGQNNV